MWPWLVLGVALMSLLGIVAGTWLRRGSPALSFQTRDWVLVADFDNQTSEVIFDRSLLTAFTVDLEQSRYSNVLPLERIKACLKRMGKSDDTRVNEALGREICLREHVKGLVTCGITKVGREYALSARLINPQTGAAVRSYRENARGQEQIIRALDKLTGRIRGDLGESLTSIRQNDEPLPLVTTASLEALKLFSDGNYLWRRGYYNEAVKAWESALNHDPDFAMAHAALGTAYMSFKFSALIKGKEHYQLALRHAERITDRERLYIQASFQHDLGHVEEASEDYRLYLKTYPDDTKARFNLGVLLMRNHREEEAIQEFKQVLRVDPANAGAWIDLATSFNELNRPAEALANYAKAFDLEPTWITLGNLNHEYGFALIRGGQVVKAREVFGLALVKPEMTVSALRSLALLDMYEGKFRDAKARLRQAILTDRDHEEALRQARNHLFLAILLDGEGDRVGHLRELDRASETLAAWSSPVLWLSARIGAAYACAGAVVKAERILRTLGSQADRENPIDTGDLHLLEGELALARGNYALAIEKLQLAAQGFHLPLALPGLCHAYQKAGDSGQASACYEKLLGLGLRALGWEPQQSWIEAHAELAEIYLSKGDNAKAAGSLNELARLWKDADSDLPLVKRMTGLLRRVQTGKL